MANIEAYMIIDTGHIAKRKAICTAERMKFYYDTIILKRKLPLK